MNDKKSDIRWEQRFSNFKKALKQLTAAVELGKQREYSDLEIQGLIQAFEFTHELAWKLIKDYLKFQGNDQLISGSRDATRTAFKLGILSDGDDWMQMIESRNLTSHTYNLEIAKEIVTKITQTYHQNFMSLRKQMDLFLS